MDLLKHGNISGYTLFDLLATGAGTLFIQGFTNWGYGPSLLFSFLLAEAVQIFVLGEKDTPLYQLWLGLSGSEERGPLMFDNPLSRNSVVRNNHGFMRAT